MFSSNHEGRYRIYAVRPDGKDIYRLTHDGPGDYKPKYAPDGSLIAFSRGVDFESDIYRKTGWFWGSPFVG